MIFTIVIKCVEGANYQEPFMRTIEVPDDMTLGELHNTIQELTGFGNDHPFTFFIARRSRGKRTEVVEAEEWEERQNYFDKIYLWNIFPLPQNKKLYYWFDFGDDWIFQIGKRGTLKMEDSHAKYPKVIAETGTKPVQYLPFE